MTTIGWLLLLAAVVLFLVIKGKYDAIRWEKRKRYQLRKQFGTPNTDEYVQKRYEMIDHYHKNRPRDVLPLDDITWNDLDMDALFCQMNQTCTGMGEEQLYDVLRSPEIDGEKLERRSRVADRFLADEGFRDDVRFHLSRLGKLRDISVYAYVGSLFDYKGASCLPDILLLAAICVATGLMIFDPTIFVVIFFAVMAINIGTYFPRRQDSKDYLQLLSYLVRMVDIARLIEKDIRGKDMESEARVLSDGEKRFKKYGWMTAFLASGTTMRGDLLTMFLDYVRMITHIDLILFSWMMAHARRHQETLTSMMDALGYLDVCQSIASFRQWQGNWTYPELYPLPKGEKPGMILKDAVHPLLDDPVANSLETKRDVLLTGSNASGKSTFLKTVAVNAVLAQTIDTVTAGRYKAPFFAIYTSMALKDNMFAGESYYIVEIRSLKRIVDAISGERPVLCMIDEVLRGTNTLERISASGEILYELASKNILCFAATHDLELPRMLEKVYDNAHFEEQIRDGQVLFDYKLHSGPSRSRNAIKLLGIMGFEKETLDAAENVARQFESEGKWPVYPDHRQQRRDK